MRSLEAESLGVFQSRAVLDGVLMSFEVENVSARIDLINFQKMANSVADLGLEFVVIGFSHPDLNQPL